MLHNDNFRNIHHKELRSRFEQLCTVVDPGERGRQVSAIVDELIALGAQAATDPLGDEILCLREFGQIFSWMVSAGTPQQQICGELAVEFGQRPRVDISPQIEILIFNPLIENLITILRIGAGPTRDSGVEGLGAILKFDGHPERKLPRQTLLENDYTGGDPRVDDIYFKRVERWRLMALAVAGHPESLEAFVYRLSEPITYIDCEHFIDVLYERADFIRTLPAIVRQAQGRDLPFDSNKLLRAKLRAYRMKTIRPKSWQPTRATRRTSSARSLSLSSAAWRRRPSTTSSPAR